MAGRSGEGWVAGRLGGGLVGDVGLVVGEG